MSEVVVSINDLDDSLNNKDREYLKDMSDLYDQALAVSEGLAQGKDGGSQKKELIELYNSMGELMQQICRENPNVHVYSFETPKMFHGEASRLIAKLRDTQTDSSEFVYYIQRAYELLFNLAFGEQSGHEKNHLIVKTPVNQPVQNFAVHKIPDIDEKIDNSVMCVMLRGALLPSMIMSKEIQEYSSAGYVTPFALFKIQRNDNKTAKDMEYILNLNKSYFNIEDLDDKDLIFADPMNATGGSFVTIVKYLKDNNIRPRSIRFFNVISALEGALNVVRAHEEVEIYTLWMDPVLNESAYILPGLGDAGDRLNGKDSEANPRNVLQLIADYGTNIVNLYRSQVRKIEETILGD